MKINNKKIIVSTLALAMGAALAGSISGSVAWYQYSTRAAAQINGVSAGTTGDLAVSIDGGTNYLHKAVSASEKYMPISASGTAGSALTYYGHPVYQTPTLPALSTLGAAPDGFNYYKDYELKFKFVESNTNTAADATTPSGTPITDKDVYLTQFAIEGDFAAAVRVEFIPASGSQLLYSANAAGETVNTKGALDLNANTKNDTALWDCTDASGAEIEYKNGSSESYATQAHSLADASNPYAISGTSLCKTDSTTILKVRVWIEGWALIGGKATWAIDTMGQAFNVNMQFACNANK